MTDTSKTLPEGAGAAATPPLNEFGAAGTGTTGTTTPPFIGSASSGADASLARADAQTTSRSFQQDEHETGYRPSGRAVVVTERPASTQRNALIAGAALAAFAGGAFLFSKRSPRGRQKSERAFVEETITIERPARQIYDFWRDFTNLPQFMDNIKSVERLSEKRSHWVIKAPAGTSVEFDSTVVEDVPGKVIAWESEPDASVPNRGRVEFTQGASGSSTAVRVTMSYDPPAGTAGRLVAKLFQREPSVQAREDLQRLKALLER